MNNKERLIKLSTAADKSYPSGWAEELFKEALDAEAGMTYRITRTDAYRLWHSFFTDLYLKSQITVYLWYPGGRLSEAVDKMEWREK
ncbi:MAG: hypothetical protein EHM45_04680 [Desulfobacteraceae bacterium]|nr:MAG: hypothetical protein EHM45_04680 [Desulfobacteraceae bacterium]